MPLAVSSDLNCAARCRGSASWIAPNTLRRRLVCRYPHDAPRSVPNFDGRSHADVRFNPFSHVIVCRGDEAIHLDDVIVLV
jgi:hypothetical protein